MSPKQRLTGTFVLVECNGGYGREYARRALTLGLDLVVLTRDPELTRGAAPAGARVRECDTTRTAAVLGAVAGLPVVGVLAGYEGALPTAAALADALGLPGPSPSAALDTFHKPRARALANSLAGNPVPCWLLSTVDDIADVTSYPVVAKPAASGGSIGVAVLHNPTQLAAHASCWLGALDERGHRFTQPLLVERYIPGEEYSVELFHGRPLALTRKSLGGGTGLVETGHVVTPWQLAPQRAAIAPYLRALVDRLGLGWGPAHLELRLYNGIPYLIEVNYRLAGDRIPELVEHAIGIDQYAATVRAAIGEPVRLAPTRQAAAAIRFLTADRAGTVARVAGIPAATAIDGITQVSITVAAGAAVHPAEQSGDRLGHVIATGPTADAAAATADAARRHIRIELMAIPAAA
jgi:S-sulfo-L-cysteine synthase (3-phospho-L-serine-dependent)